MRISLNGIVLGLSVSALPLSVSPAFGQSLADVARQENARRKEIKEPSKVLTNKDLASVPAPPPPAAASAAAGDSDKASGKTEDKATDTDKTAKDDKAAGNSKDEPKGQAYWSEKMKGLQTQLDRDQVFAEALQSRINGLTADFSARDDPAQRGMIERDRQKAVEELDRLKKAIQADKKAVADLQEEARRASVPPGWLR